MKHKPIDEKVRFLWLCEDFLKHIEWFNKERKQPLEDDIESTFINFIKWLDFELNKKKS